MGDVLPAAPGVTHATDFQVSGYGPAGPGGPRFQAGCPGLRMYRELLLPR
jgi:hypothetical protein